jgi:hypothetical protein
VKPHLLLVLGAALLGTAGAAEQIAVQPGKWDIRVAYPQFRAGGVVSAMADAEMRKAEVREFQDFLARARREVPKLARAGNPNGYSLAVKPHVGVDLPGVASGYVDRLTFVGGARPDTSYDAFTWGLVREKARKLFLRDLFRPGTNAVDEASAALLVELKRADAPSDVATGRWTRLTHAQAARFVVTRSGLLFLFPPGELGPHAEGERRPLVPYDRLPSLNRSGVLADVFRGRAFTRAAARLGETLLFHATRP